MRKDRIIARRKEAYLRPTPAPIASDDKPQKPRDKRGQPEERDHEDHVSCRRSPRSVLASAPPTPMARVARSPIPSSPRSRAWSPRRRCRTPRPSRRRRTGRRCTPTPPSRTTARGCSRHQRRRRQRLNRIHDREAGEAGTTAGLSRFGPTASGPGTRGTPAADVSTCLSECRALRRPQVWIGDRRARSTWAVAQVTAPCARGRHPARDGGMRCAPISLWSGWHWAWSRYGRPWCRSSPEIPAH